MKRITTIFLSLLLFTVASFDIVAQEARNSQHGFEIHVSTYTAHDRVVINKPVTYTLYDEETDEILAEKTSQTGAVTFEGIDPGYYIVEQTEGPQGFIRYEEVVRLSIHEDTEERIQNISFYNNQGTLSLHLKSDTSKVSNVEFTVFNMQEPLNLITLTTDEFGNASTYELAPGNYRVFKTFGNSFTINPKKNYEYDKNFEFTIPAGSNAGNDSHEAIFHEFDNSVTITTIDSKTQKPAEGVLVTLKDFRTLRTVKALSNKDGIATFTNIFPDFYSIILENADENHPETMRLVNSAKATITDLNLYKKINIGPLYVNVVEDEVVEPTLPMTPDKETPDANVSETKPETLAPTESTPSTSGGNTNTASTISKPSPEKTKEALVSQEPITSTSINNKDTDAQKTTLPQTGMANTSLLLAGIIICTGAIVVIISKKRPIVR